MSPELVFAWSAHFFVLGVIAFFVYQMWWRGELIRKKLICLFPKGKEGDFFESSVLDEHGVYHVSLDCGRYQVALFTQSYSKLTEYFFVLKQPIPFGLDLPEGVYGPGGIHGPGGLLWICGVVGSFSEELGYRIFRRSDLNLENLVHDFWHFAEVSGGNLILFYKLPKIFGYGCLEEVATWVSEHYG